MKVKAVDERTRKFMILFVLVDEGQCLFAWLCILLKTTRGGGGGGKHSRLRIDGTLRMDGFSFWVAAAP